METGDEWETWSGRPVRRLFRNVAIGIGIASLALYSVGSLTFGRFTSQKLGEGYTRNQIEEGLREEANSHFRKAMYHAFRPARAVAYWLHEDSS